nr:sulfotransferase domain-containing protein [Roseovarius mucosus]
MQSVLRIALDPAFPSDTWRNKWINPSVDPKKMKNYVASKEWRHQTTLVKLHMAFTEDMSYLFDPNIKVIVTYRNIPDSILSYFHHQIRLNETSIEEKENWFQSVGVEFAYRLANHRLSWLPVSNAHCVRYENMLAQPKQSILETMRFLEVPISSDKLEKVLEGTKVKRKKPVEGSHIRTAGQSRAEIEIPANTLQILKDIDATLERSTSEILSAKH